MHPIEHLRYVARAGGADPVMVAIEAMSAMRSLDPSGLVVACRRVLARHPTNGPLWWACSELLSTTERTTRRSHEITDRLEDDRTGTQLAAHLPDDGRVLVTGWAPTVAAGLERRGDVFVTVAGRSYGSDALARSLARYELDLDDEADGGRLDHVDMEQAAIVAASCDLVLLEASAVSTGSAIADVGSAVLAAVATAADVPTWLVAGRGRRLPRAYVDAVVERLGADARCDTDWLDPGACARIVGPDGIGEPSAATLGAECPFVGELLASLA